MRKVSEVVLSRVGLRTVALKEAHGSLKPWNTCLKGRGRAAQDPSQGPFEARAVCEGDHPNTSSSTYSRATKGLVYLSARQIDRLRTRGRRRSVLIAHPSWIGRGGAHSARHHQDHRRGLGINSYSRQLHFEPTSLPYDFARLEPRTPRLPTTEDTTLPRILGTCARDSG